jgi:hypothetical protein
MLERLLPNPAVGDATLARVAERCDEGTSELIATNQQRLLAAPQIIEALYRNPKTRMSTADRLVELAVRNNVELEGIPAFKEHAAAIRGQLIPEPTDEPLPTDSTFREALEEHDAEEDAIERDEVDGTEELKERHAPLSHQISQMSPSEKVRLALIGKAAARAILVRDPNKLVSHAAISSPKMTENEAVGIAHSKEVSEDVLRYIGNKKEWGRNYEIKRALLYNPKTPIAIALKYIPHMRDNDLKSIARSRNVAQPVKVAVKQRLNAKQRR